MPATGNGKGFFFFFLDGHTFFSFHFFSRGEENNEGTFSSFFLSFKKHQKFNPKPKMDTLRYTQQPTVCV
jgi:hypothetical protein